MADPVSLNETAEGISEEAAREKARCRARQLKLAASLRAVAADLETDKVRIYTSEVATSDSGTSVRTSLNVKLIHNKE